MLRVVAGLGLLGVAWLALPRAAAKLSWFRVRRIELVGVRHLEPDMVIGALRLGPRANVFTDVNLLADRVRGVAGVAEARVVRRLPGVLRVMVREVEPVVFVPGRHGLEAVDGGGTVLPFDPARATLDLPIAERTDTAVAGVLALVRAAEPGLFSEVEYARATSRGDVSLDWESHRVLLRRDAEPEDIRAVVLVAQDLTARGRRYAELDARYAGQVVVRRRRSE